LGKLVVHEIHPSAKMRHKAADFKHDWLVR